MLFRGLLGLPCKNLLRAWSFMGRLYLRHLRKHSDRFLPMCRLFGAGDVLDVRPPREEDIINVADGPRDLAERLNGQLRKRRDVAGGLRALLLPLRVVVGGDVETLSASRTRRRALAAFMFAALAVAQRLRQTMGYAGP